MSKMFKCMCLLVMSVFCMSSISPSLVVFADDSLSANSKVVSGETQFKNGSSVRFGDTQVNILSDEVLEVVNVFWSYRFYGGWPMGWHNWWSIYWYANL